MLKTRSLLAGLALAGLTACAIPGIPQIGGPLSLHVLAVTEVDAVTGNTDHLAVLEWPSAFNAKTYEVIREFEGDTAKVLASLEEDRYTDTTVGAGQTFTYQVRALSGENQELTVSDTVQVMVLPQEVAKPAGLSPEDNAQIGVGEDPTFSWQPAAGADWYYVSVTKVQDNSRVWSALTAETSIAFGADSPLRFEHFGDQFPVGEQSSITAGLVYEWSVKAIRLNAEDPREATAVDVNPSAVQRFSQG